MPVTLEQKSRHSAGSTRKNLAVATACSLSIKSESCCDGLPFATISIFAPGTAASMRDFICSRDSIIEAPSSRAKSRDPAALPSRFRTGIPRLRFAPLGMTKTESSFDAWRMKHASVCRWFQIMHAKFRHRKFAWLFRIEMRCLVCAGQFLFIDLVLQFHERV